MKMPQLRMQSQMAQIEIQQTPGNQVIRQPKADISIQQPKPEIRMRTTPSRLTIDQTKAFEDMNLMNILKRNEKFAQEGKQAVLDGIARRAQQGTELMKIEHKGKPAITQAVQNAFPPMKRLGITFIPSPFSVKTSYQPSQLQIDVQTHRPITNARPKQVEHDYEKGEVNIRMKQYQHLTIEVAYPDEEAQNV
jgi:Family of unknown function (DUF6470)